MKALRLVRIDFNNEKEINPLEETSIITIVEEEGKTAFLKLQEWVLEYTQPVKLYLGWDLKLYPQWKAYQEEVL